jgi:hypothetical protein
MNLSADRSSFPRFSWRFVLLPIDGGSADRSSFPRFSWSIQEISADRKQFPTLQLKISYPDERISKDPDRPSYRSIVEVGGGVFASLKRRSAFPVPDQWGVELAAADFVEMIALRFELQIAPSRQMCVFYFRSRQRAFFLFTEWCCNICNKSHNTSKSTWWFNNFIVCTEIFRIEMFQFFFLLLVVARIRRRTCTIWRIIKDGLTALERYGNYTFLGTESPIFYSCSIILSSSVHLSFVVCLASWIGCVRVLCQKKLWSTLCFFLDN